MDRNPTGESEMAQETERKFLVRGDFKAHAKRAMRIVQGYLSSVPERTVRVRIKGDQGYLTIKGIGNESGASRYEWEREIPVEDARELLALSEPGVIDKTRHVVEFAGKEFEIDEFHGDNQGLIIAELELQYESERYDKPDWLGEEVTGDERYYNAMLAKNPYKNW